jgi:hypothetical protein
VERPSTSLRTQRRASGGRSLIVLVALVLGSRRAFMPGTGLAGADRPVSGSPRGKAKGNLEHQMAGMGDGTATHVKWTNPASLGITHRPWSGATSSIAPGGSPAVANGRLFLRNFEYLYCIGKSAPRR